MLSSIEYAQARPAAQVKSAFRSVPMLMSDGVTSRSRTSFFIYFKTMVGSAQPLPCWWQKCKPMPNMPPAFFGIQCSTSLTPTSVQQILPTHLSECASACLRMALNSTGAWCCRRAYAQATQATCGGVRPPRAMRAASSGAAACAHENCGEEVSEK